MGTDAVAVLGFIALFALMLLRVPVGMAMGLVGVCGFGYLVGFTPALKLVGQTSMRTVTDYTFGVIPMFLLMGTFVSNSGMEQILINLVAGALGGLGAGKSSSTFDLGTAGNIISGLVGGGLLGQIATLLLPTVLAAAQSGNMSVSGIVSQVVAGGAGGAILTAIIGAIKNRAAA